MDAALAKLVSLLPKPEPKQEYWALMAYNQPDIPLKFAIRFSLATHQDALNAAFALDPHGIWIIHSPSEQENSTETGVGEEMELVLAG